MFAAEAARLAAIEVLAPTAANMTGTGFPTLAGRNVFDSSSAPVSALDGKRDYTPVMSLYTREASQAMRGEAGDASDYEGRSVLEIVAELATAVRDEQGGDFADAIAAGDPRARVELTALVAQIRWLLLEAEAGYLFRRQIIRCDKIEQETHAVPEFGLRWQRVFLRLHLVVPVDRFSDAGGLPEPAASLAAALPAQSYAKRVLTGLAGAFAGQDLPGLDGITVHNSDGDPIASA